MSVNAMLEKACTELRIIRKERFVMQHMAKIEACCKGETDFIKIEQLKWYDYSGCIKKYVW